MRSETVHPALSEALTPDNLVRLKRAAGLFDVHVTELDADIVHFHVLDKHGWRDFDLARNLATARLAVELCSKTIRWVYYRPDVNCALTFLRLPDAKIDRLAQLYQRWKKAGFPET